LFYQNLGVYGGEVIKVTARCCCCCYLLPLPLYWLHKIGPCFVLTVQKFQSIFGMLCYLIGRIHVEQIEGVTAQQTTSRGRRYWATETY